MPVSHSLQGRQMGSTNHRVSSLFIAFSTPTPTPPKKTPTHGLSILTTTVTKIAPIAPYCDKLPNLYQRFKTCEFHKEKEDHFFCCCCHLYPAKWRPPAMKCSPFLNFTPNTSMESSPLPQCHSFGFDWYSFRSLLSASQAVQPQYEAA